MYEKNLNKQYDFQTLLLPEKLRIDHICLVRHV